MAYTPGPALLLCVVLGCTGAVLRRRDRRAILALAFAACGVGSLVMPSLGAGFDYRYALPAQLFLPAAGVLGAALLRTPRRAAATADPGGWLTEVCRRHRGLVGSGAAAAVALVLVGNAAGAEMLPADKQRPGPPKTLGATARLADGQVAAQASNPELLHVSCGKWGKHERIGWLISFDISVQVLAGPHRLVQVDDFALYGDGRDPFARPTSTKRRTVFPDAVLSAGSAKSGKIQFLVHDLSGTLIYNAEPDGGVVAWKYTLVAPPKPNQSRTQLYTLVPPATADLPGALCETPPPDSPAATAPPEPWGPPQQLSTRD
jgi:hypothetical protein